MEMEFREPEPNPHIWNDKICDIFAAKEDKITKNGAYVAQVKEGEELSISQVVETVRETQEHRYF